MLQRVKRAIGSYWLSRRERAYQRFLALLAESPTEWIVLESGAIRSSQDECPIVEVYQRVTEKYGQADTKSRYDVLRVARASDLDLSIYRALMIMGAADDRTGSFKQIGVRNDILTALARARKRMDATAKGMLAAECRWTEEGVGV